MSKTEQIAEKVIVTAVQADVIYILTASNFHWGKAGIYALLGAALSAVYNVLRQSNPTMVDNVVKTVETIDPDLPVAVTHSLTPADQALSLESEQSPPSDPPTPATPASESSPEA